MKNIPTPDKVLFFCAEGSFTLSFALFGAAVSQKDFLGGLVLALSGVMWYGITALLISKYKIKPFFYKWLPKTSQAYFSDEVRT